MTKHSVLWLWQNEPPPPHPTEGSHFRVIGKGLWLGGEGRGGKDRTSQEWEIVQNACSLRKAALIDDFDGPPDDVHTVCYAWLQRGGGGSHISLVSAAALALRHKIAECGR